MFETFLIFMFAVGLISLVVSFFIRSFSPHVETCAEATSRITPKPFENIGWLELQYNDKNKFKVVSIFVNPTKASGFSTTSHKPRYKVVLERLGDGKRIEVFCDNLSEDIESSFVDGSFVEIVDFSYVGFDKNEDDIRLGF